MVEVNELDLESSVGHCLGMVIFPKSPPHVDVNKRSGLGLTSIDRPNWLIVGESAEIFDYIIMISDFLVDFFHIIPISVISPFRNEFFPWGRCI